MYNEYYVIDISVESLLKYGMYGTSTILYTKMILMRNMKVLIIQTEGKHDREKYISDI